MAFVPEEDWPKFTGYTALDTSRREIRVLQILPGDGPTIETVLSHVSLTDQGHIPYCALSYNWGKASEMRVVLVSGQQIQLRRTVWAFLDSLRQSLADGDSIAVWLDIICINQREIAEKNSQVSMMADIYRSSERTFAWLDESDGWTDYALDAMVEIDQFMRDLTPPGIWRASTGEGVPRKVFIDHDEADKWFENLDPEDERAFDDEAGEEFDESGEMDRRLLLHTQTYFPIGDNRLMLSLEALFRRPYWGRVWVIQEMYLSEEVILCCGSRQVPLVVFWNSSLYLKRYYHQFGQDPRGVVNDALNIVWFILRPYMQAKTSSYPPNDIAELQERFGYCQCGEPRDLVYGFLGMYPGPQAKLIQVDYQRSWLQVWQDCINAFTHHHHRWLFESGPALSTLWARMGLRQEKIARGDLDALEGEKQTPQLVVALAGIVRDCKAVFASLQTGSTFLLSERLICPSIPVDKKSGHQIICCSLDEVRDGDICVLGAAPRGRLAALGGHEMRTAENAILDLFGLIILRWREGRLVFTGTAKCFCVSTTFSSSSATEREHVYKFMFDAIAETQRFGKLSFTVHLMESETPNYAPSSTNLAEPETDEWGKIAIGLEEGMKTISTHDVTLYSFVLEPDIHTLATIVDFAEPVIASIPACRYLPAIRLSSPATEQGLRKRLELKLGQLSTKAKEIPSAPERFMDNWDTLKMMRYHEMKGIKKRHVASWFVKDTLFNTSDNSMLGGPRAGDFW